MKPDIIKQIQEAKIQVRKMKRSNPYLFPEYLALKTAESELKQARERVRLARDAWKKIGN